MAGVWKIFHFQELDWLIGFPNVGNEGRKYLYYRVTFVDRKNPQQPKQTTLTDIIDSPAFDNGFPHTVGYFKGAVCDDVEVPSCYLELRMVRSLEEFWKFLNDLNI